MSLYIRSNPQSLEKGSNSDNGEGTELSWVLRTRKMATVRLVKHPLKWSTTETWADDVNSPRSSYWVSTASSSDFLPWPNPLCSSRLLGMWRTETCLHKTRKDLSCGVAGRSFSFFQYNEASKKSLHFKDKFCKILQFKKPFQLNDKIIQGELINLDNLLFFF